MKCLPSPRKIASSNPFLPPSPWPTDFPRFPAVREAPGEAERATMRTSKSQLSLRALSDYTDGSDLDRTANSTPALKGKMREGRSGGLLAGSQALKPDSSNNRGVTFTPPVGKPAKWNKSCAAHNKFFDNSNDSGIYLQGKAEDNVFGDDTQLHPQVVRDAAIARKDGVKSAPNKDDSVSALREVSFHFPEAQNQVAVPTLVKNTANAELAPRSDRLLEPITPSNAQGVLPPAAAIFVANLSVHRTDDQLEISCHEAFDQFGLCIVKVRRDKHKHPYALIQYHTTQDAARAIEGGQNLIINDRAIRVEPAECRRSVILSRIGGGAVAADEARGLLGKYGSIAKIHPTTHADARNHGVPEGVWVEFGYYLDFKDCLKAFNNTTNLYRVTEAPNLEPRIRPGGVVGSPNVKAGLHTPRSTTDQKSIYVGNLPESTTEAQLKEIFDVYGEIKGCNVIRKPISGGTGYNIFGFIEFATEAQALPASSAMVDIEGQRIRVEPKEYSSRRHRRCQEQDQEQAVERNRRGIAWRSPQAPAWGRHANTYRSPRSELPYNVYGPYGPYNPYGPYGPQPVFMMPTPQGLVPFHSGYPPGHGWTKTPPTSVPRQQAPGPDGFYMGGPPPQFIPLASPTIGMETFHSP